MWLSAKICSRFQVGFQIKTRVQELGHGCIYMVQKAGALQLSPTDSFSKRELIECARAVMEKVRRPNTPAMDHFNATLVCWVVVLFYFFSSTSKEALIKIKRLSKDFNENL